MRSSSMPALLIVILNAFVIGIVDGQAFAGKALMSPFASISQEQEISFNLTRLAENPKRYSLIVTEGEERSISGAFSIDQLQILKTIMAEAERFAINGEAVGTKDSLTTRFSDKHESAFLVDVEKLGAQSKLYLTIETEIGRVTFDAGRVFRTTRREQGMYFDLLSKLESVLPKLPVNSAK